MIHVLGGKQLLPILKLGGNWISLCIKKPLLAELGPPRDLPYDCASELHSANYCTYAPADQLESPRPVVEICKLFNAQAGNKCHHTPCKYAHICRNYSGRHPASAFTRYPYMLAPSAGSGRWRFN